jgi:hypothetical protein
MMDARRVAHGEHLSREFSRELVAAYFAAGLDIRFLDPGVKLATPESLTWAIIGLDWFNDSGGVATFDQDTIAALIRAAARAIIITCPPSQVLAQYVVQSAMVPGGCLCILSRPPHVFGWISAIRATGEHRPATTILRRTPK